MSFISRVSRLAFAGIVLLVLTSASFLAAQSEDTPADALAANYDALLPPLLETLSVPGVALAVVDDGQVVWTGSYGVADSATGEPVTDETQFLVASLSKAVTSWAVLALAEAGDMDLDAPVESYLTSWHIPPLRYDANEVTIRRILSHTAGLTVEGYDGFPEDAALPALPAFLDGEGGGRVAINSEPGRRHRYSGGGYTVLQLTFEDLTGEAYADVMQRTVFEPLGMTHSTYDQQMTEMTATGHDYSGNPRLHEIHVDLAAGGLYTTAADMAQFLAAAMPGPDGEPAGRGLLSPHSVAELYTPAPVDNEQYAFGAYIVPLTDGSTMAWHDGLNPGYKALFVTLPESGDALVVLSNGVRGDQLFGDVTCAWATWAQLDTETLCGLF